MSERSLPPKHVIEGIRHDTLEEFFARLKVLARESSDTRLSDLVRLVAAEMKFDEVDAVEIGPHDRQCVLCGEHQRFDRREVQILLESIDRLKIKIWHRWSGSDHKDRKWINIFGEWLRRETLTND